MYYISRKRITILYCILAILAGFFATLESQAHSLHSDFLETLYEFVPDHFKSASLPVSLQSKATAIWQEIKTEGMSVQSDGEAIATIFAHLQADIEKELTDKLLSQTVQSVWIIHTPLLPTPLVVQENVSKNSKEQKDETRLNIAKARSHVLHDYLAKGGILITLYEKDKREGKNGRTKDQIALFENLKKQYPLQLIECPIEKHQLPNGEFPVDKIGATYLMQNQDGNHFVMTLRGVQLNQSLKNATWGIWLPKEDRLQPEVEKRFREMKLFFKQVGLHEALLQHAKQHGIAAKRVLAPLALLPQGNI